MSSLYELNAKLASYQMEFDPDTGEWLNEDELIELNMAKEEKRENIALWEKNLEAEAQMVYTEAKSLLDRHKKLINKAQHLHDYLALDLDGEPFKTARVDIRWRKSEAVEITNEDAVPDRFLDISVVRKPAKNEIKKYLKEAEAKGEEVPWARLNRKNNMVLK